MVLKLYKLDPSPPARAAMMAVEALKAPVEFVDCNLFTKEHYSPEYLKKNPLHTVPLLEDGDFHLADSHAIMIYLAEITKNTDLYPSDPKKRAVVNARLFFDTGSLFPSLRRVTYFVFYEGLKGPTAQNLDDIEKCYEFTEAFLSKTKFIADDKITLADLSCVADVAALNIVHPIDHKKYPKIIAWWNAMKQQPYYKKFEHGNEQLEKAFKAALQKNNA